MEMPGGWVRWGMGRNFAGSWQGIRGRGLRPPPLQEGLSLPSGQRVAGRSARSRALPPSLVSTPLLLPPAPMRRGPPPEPQPQPRPRHGRPLRLPTTPPPVPSPRRHLLPRLARRQRGHGGPPQHLTQHPRTDMHIRRSPAHGGSRLDHHPSRVRVLWVQQAAHPRLLGPALSAVQAMFSEDIATVAA